MINIEEIKNEWKKDCEIDKNNLDEESLRLPSLHAKYLMYLDQAKIDLRQIKIWSEKQLYTRWRWIEGKLTKEEMDVLNWPYDPFAGHAIRTKEQKDKFYRADLVYLECQDRLSMTEDNLMIIKEMLTNITWRHQTIKNAIEWRKFISGQ